jgi:hypothetical protein
MYISVFVRAWLAYLGASRVYIIVHHMLLKVICVVPSPFIIKLSSHQPPAGKRSFNFTYMYRTTV